MASKYGYMATIGADTSGLTSALQTVDSEAKKISSELREINKNLKFEDGGAVALQQKYDLLNSAIEQTAQKLEMLKKAENDVNAAAESGKISEANQRFFQRELDSTANKLARYQKEAEETNKVLQDMASGQQTANNAMQTSEEIADIVQKAMQRYTDSSKNASASNKEESESLDEVGESAKNAAEELKKITLSNNIGYDESAIDYIENFGKKTEEAVSAYDKYKSSVGETNEAIRQAETEYNKLNKMLADNADNQVLAAQKNEIKNQLIEAETYKLDKLNQQYNDLKQAFDNGDIGAEQFREFQREVELTKIKLDELQKSEEDATDAVEDFGEAIEGAGQQTITFGDLLKANVLGDLVASGFHRAGSEISDFVKQGVDLASNLTEVQNVVDTTFGDGAAQIYQWADAAAESFGMSSLAAQQYNGTMGAMLKSMGLADNEVKKMSMDMVGLAGDMASFRNLDVETVFNKIRSGISGETEPLKQLGINMSVANLEAYALAQGIETAYDKMSQSEQAILRYNYLMSVTADAQGDFARTSDSFANQQRILELQTQNLAASLGQKLLPSLNEVLVTVNEKLPRMENTAENIGKIIGKVTEFALDNHEAILSLITAYGTFYGVMKAGNAIGTAVTAIKSLTTATKSAEAAQHGMNAAAAANPYVLLASAVAAVTVGLIAFANSADTVHNELKDINKDIENLRKNTDESIESAETEIAVFKDKARQYEELIDKANRTAGEEEKLVRLAEELQQYMPEGTRLIDEQTGAYNSLADSIDSVANAMRRKATISAYEDEYTGLIKQQLEAEKALEDAIKKEAELSALKEGGPWYLKTASSIAYDVAKKDLSEAQKLVDDLDNQIGNLDKKITEFYDDQESTGVTGFYDTDSALSTTGRYYEEQGKLAVEAAEKEKATREQNLSDFVADLDKRKSLRKISEQKYYDDLYGYLIEHEDRESEEWFKQLGRYEDYQQKQADAAAKSAEKAASEQEKQEKEAAEKRINIIKGYWDDITRMKDRGEIGDEEEYKLKAQIVKKYCDESEDTWDSYYKWLYDYTKKQEEEIADARLKAWDDNAKALSDKLEKSYSDLKSQKEQVRKELLNIDLSETFVDKNGNDIEILNDLDDEIKKIDKYVNSLKKLEATGISDSLLAKIGEMSYEDGSRQRMIDTLLNLSESGRQKYYSDWERLYAKEAEAEQKLFGDKEAELNQETANAVKDIFKSMPDDAYDEGVKTAQSYLQGIIDSMEGVNDINAVSAIFSSAYSDMTDTSRGSSKTGTGLTDGQKYVLASTPITLIVNGEKKEKTIEEIMDEASRSGGNPLHF